MWFDALVRFRPSAPFGGMQPKSLTIIDEKICGYPLFPPPLAPSGGAGPFSSRLELTYFTTDKEKKLNS